MAYQGKFRPNNPKKYKGDPTNIVYRSRWESRFMSYLDTHDEVISWASEEIVIPYMSPMDGRVHRYFPDFYVKVRQKDGTIKESIVEIKPYQQTQEPKANKNRKRYITEVTTYVINRRKWEVAEAYCKARGWDFKLVTERDLGLTF